MSVDPTPWLVGGLLVLQLVVRLVASTTGSFWGDDFMLNQWAASAEPGLGYFLPAFGDHLEAVGHFFGLLTVRVFGGSYFVASLWPALMFCGGTYFLYRLLDEVFGWRVQFYLVILLVSFSPISVGPYLWYSVSFHTAPYVFFGFLTMWLAWRYVRRKSWRRLLACAASVLLLTLSYELAYVVPLAIFAMVAIIPVDGRARLGIRRAVTTYWRLWVVLGTMYLVLAVVYLTKTTASPIEASADQVSGAVLRGLGSATIPAIFGGPWSYNVILGAEWPTFSTVAVLSVIAFLVLVVVVLPLAKPRAAIMWISVLVLLASQWIIVAFGRGFVNESFPVVMRYAAPGILLLAVPIAYSMASGRGERDGWNAFALPLVLWWRDLAQVSRTVMSSVLAGALCISLAVGLQSPIYGNPFLAGKGYIAQARATSDRIPPGQAILSQLVPPQVANDRVLPRTISSTEVVLGQNVDGLLFAPTVLDELYGFADDGTAHRQAVAGTRPAKIGPNGGCGWAVRSEPVEIELSDIRDEGDYTVEMATFSEQEHAFVFELLDGERAGQKSTVAIPPGLHTVFFWLNSPGSAGTLRITPQGDAKRCVTDIKVGTGAHVVDGEFVNDKPATEMFDINYLR
ncbi:MAG: hypothetical protein HQ526_11000 [Actinobacteria bacterium]|nr:hypothetical protein [Actinomycetota bacterium]